MKLTKDQLFAITNKIKRKIQDSISSEDKKLNEEYIPSNNYNKVNSLHDEIKAYQELIHIKKKELNTLLGWSSTKWSEDKNYVLEQIKRKEISEKLPKYNFEEIHDDVVISTIEAKDFDLEKLIGDIERYRK